MVLLMSALVVALGGTTGVGSSTKRALRESQARAVRPLDFGDWATPMGARVGSPR
jgi:hypothetical protein